MSETLDMAPDFEIERLNGKVRDADVLLFAGLHKISHPERQYESIPELTDTLQDYARPYKFQNAIFVARNQRFSTIAGAAMIDLKEGGAHVSEILVDPRKRGIGLGRALLRQCIAFAAENGAPFVQIDHAPVDKKSKKFFEQAGFEPSADGVPRLTFEATEN